MCWEERKERKERKNRYAKLNRGRWKRFIYIKDQLQGEKNRRKSQQMNKCTKIIIGLKIKTKEKEKKENSTELQKPNIVAVVYKSNKKWIWGGKKAQELN